ncbi:MAG: FAD-dependent oxidoreductase [Planctomycetota bacterium]|jgi:protoporphyrinogen oxidase
MHVVIVGAGVSGLSVAAVLVKGGFEVTIFERDGNVGGLAASFTKNNYIFDFGPHIFFGKNIIPELSNFFDVNKEIFENRNLKQAIYIQGKLFSHPFRLKEILTRIEKRKLPKAILGAAVSHLAGRNEEQTLEGWVKSRLGTALFDYIELDTYVRKLYGIPAREISSDWGKHRLKPIANLNLWRVLRMAANPWAKDKKRYTYYCPGGIGAIADHLADYVTDHGGKILLGSSVEKMVARDGRVEEVMIKQEGKHRTVGADLVVSSVKIRDLVCMIEPKPGAEVLGAANSIRYRDLIILYLVVDKPKLFDHCLIYFSTKDTLFKRITEYKHFSPRMVPENLTSLSVEICLNPGDDIGGYGDKEIFDRVITEMEGLGITNSQEVLEYFTVRIPAVYPVYFLNYESPLRVLLDYLAGVPNLISIGRRGLYQHDNMPTAIQSGIDVGRLIIEHGMEDFGKVNRIVYEERLHKYRHVS